MVVQPGSLDAKELDGMNGTAPDPRRWWALALLCAAFSMVILDVAIVNVALPSIQKDLHFTQENLQWIVTAYALTFGGLLLLGGRLSDLLGRRLVFVSGVAVFTAASLWCAVSWGEGSLISHWRSSCENPRSTLIDGSATFTIAMSRTTMNWTALSSASAIHLRLSEVTIVVPFSFLFGR